MTPVEIQSGLIYNEAQKEKILMADTIYSDVVSGERDKNIRFEDRNPAAWK